MMQAAIPTDKSGLLRSKVSQEIGRNIFRLICIIYSIIIIFPFIWMFYNSFKTNFEFNQSIWALPETIRWENYVLAIDRANMGVYMLNSLLIVSVAIVLNVGLSAVISYTISRFKFWGSSLIYKLFLAGILMPRILTLIPYFFLIHELGLYNTRFSVIIALVFWGMSFAVFLLTAFFKTLPTALEESARIDGASYFKAFIYIMLPLARSGLITVTIFNFLEFWSTYILPLTLISSDSKKPVALGLMEFSSGVGVRMDYGAMFAASIMSILPLVLLFAFFQKRLISGLTAGSIKQ